MNTYEQLLSIRSQRGAGYLLLLDPDKVTAKELPSLVQRATTAGVDGFLFGSSMMLSNDFDGQIKLIKANTDKPVIIFPGSTFQVSPFADAILFLVLVSGRNPEHLIGAQVIAAPMIKKVGLESISTAYMLIESGITTAAEYISQSKPIPRAKSDIAVAHALAAEMIGMKLIYLDAGSGAQYSVPETMIAAIHKHCKVPIVVGGGIRTPEEARKKVEAGASFIVAGTIFEENASHSSLMKQFADVIHSH
jgi:putative glycerol-1-phosphate prenyltransferase